MHATNSAAVSTAQACAWSRRQTSELVVCQYSAEQKRRASWSPRPIWALGHFPMRTRVILTVDDDVYRALERLSDQRDESVARVALNLIEEALEYQEDLHFSQIADDRIARRQEDRAFKRHTLRAVRV